MISIKIGWNWPSVWKGGKKSHHFHVYLFQLNLKYGSELQLNKLELPFPEYALWKFERKKPNGSGKDENVKCLRQQQRWQTTQQFRSDKLPWTFGSLRWDTIFSEISFIMMYKFTHSLTALHLHKSKSNIVCAKNSFFLKKEEIKLCFNYPREMHTSLYAIFVQCL